MNKAASAYKSDDSPPPKEEMHSIGSTVAKEADKREVEDGLRLQKNIPKWAREAMGVKGRDELWTRAAANGKEIEYIARLHKNGRTFVLPKDERQELSLDVGDSVKFWAAKYEEGQEQNGEQKAATANRGDSLSSFRSKTDDEDEQDEQRNLVRFDPPTDAQFHIKDGDKTLCGKSLDERGTVEITDPGDALRPCLRCNIEEPEDLSIEHMVSRLSERAGFEYSKDNPSYFNKEQIVALTKYVLDSEQSQEA